MYNTFKIKLLLLTGLLVMGIVINACKKEEDPDTDAIQLFSFGPSPVLRGGDLKFIGTNLDKVTAVVLSNNVQVTTFKSKAADQLVIVVPEETVNGAVVLKTPQGDITTKTILTISEPIAITSFSPAKLRPGEVLTINGTYLNLIKEVIFSNKKSVLDSAFVSKTQTKLEVKVPADAQTGLVVLSNGLADPILVESATALEVTLPAVSKLTPNPVKAGQALTIEGTDLDLTKEIIFGGGVRVSSFVSVEPGKLVANVPANAKDGAIKLVAASLVEVESTEALGLVVPTIASVSPNPAKNGTDITVTGTDLDLVTKATFGGGKDGALKGGTATEITITVPIDATDGSITFSTAAGKTVSSASALAMVKPAISGIAPLDVQFTKQITISGTDLDLVTRVKFTGGTEALAGVVSATEVTATVPVGTQSGAITLVTTNGSEIASSQAINILASTSATVTSMPNMAKPGQMIDIVGENLDEVTELIFPGDVSATMFGQKSATLIQVVIPMNVQTGVGKIKMITVNGETIETPEINIQGVDPVADPTLVFFNFDDLGLWWGDTGGPENDPSYSLDGTNYYRVNKDCNGWTGFFWRNGQNNFPGPTIGTNVANYVLKFDVNVLEPITGGEFAWRLKGSSGDFWYRWKPWEASGSYKTDGWITISVPVTEFNDGTKAISDLSTITEDFGVAFNSGASHVNACIDNVRFELK
ncbi:MAG: IPT/TIG domain-containing protein [Saprospiraceae bacterium]|nr:IPT/TIG domain-containing protein [Saprospiraceae bacterium]